MFEKIKNKEKIINRDSILYSQNDLIDKIIIIKSGKAKVVKYLPSGKEMFIKEINKGDIIGETLIFLNKKYPATIISITQLKYIEIEKHELLNQLKNEKFLIDYMKYLSTKIENLNNIINILSNTKIEKRLAYYLINEYENNNIINIKSKKDLSQKLNTTRETISRIIKRFIKDDILIQENKIIKIINIDKLEKILLKA